MFHVEATRADIFVGRSIKVSRVLRPERAQPKREALRHYPPTRRAL